MGFRSFSAKTWDVESASPFSVQNLILIMTREFDRSDPCFSYYAPKGGDSN